MLNVAKDFFIKNMPGLQWLKKITNNSAREAGTRAKLQWGKTTKAHLPPCIFASFRGPPCALFKDETYPPLDHNAQ